MTTTEADRILSVGFAPRVFGPGLFVEAVGEDRAVLRLPWSDRLSREGGGLSGQALTAAADTATAIAAPVNRCDSVPVTTVQQSTSFQRAVTGSDVLIEAVLAEPGHRTAFAGITMSDGRSGAPAVRASTVYALLG
ncbi:thioesterase [Streptomyces sp. NPDC001220]